MAKSERAVRKRRPQERAEVTRSKLIDVAVRQFSEHSWRLQWLMSAFLRPGMTGLREQVEEDLRINDADFVHWYYLFVSCGALPFSIAPEARELFGVDVLEEAFVTRHARLMVEFLLPRLESS